MKKVYKISGKFSSSGLVDYVSSYEKTENNLTVNRGMKTFYRCDFKTSTEYENAINYYVLKLENDGYIRELRDIEKAIKGLNIKELAVVANAVRK